MILQQEFDPAVTSLCVAARCLREAARGKVTAGSCVLRHYKDLGTLLPFFLNACICRNPRSQDANEMTYSGC